MPFGDLTAEQFENIQRYLDGLMTPGEEKLFEDQMEGNQQLHEALKFENELRDFLEAPEEKAFLQEAGIDPETGYEDIHNIRPLVEKEGTNWKQKKNKPFTLRSILLYAIAASVIGFIAFFIWLASENKNSGLAKTNSDRLPAIKNSDTQNVAKIQIPKQKDLVTLFSEYFTMDKISVNEPELLTAALDDYDKGKYEKIRGLDLTNLPTRVLTRDASEDESENKINNIDNVKQLGHYYKGVALIKIDKLSEAKTNLLWVIDSAISNTLKIKSQWYISLIYLKEGNANNKVVPFLKRVAASSIVPFNNKAKDLLNNLDK